MLEQMIFYLLPDKESIGDKKVIFFYFDLFALFVNAF
jgi:hypothetical protein